ncbi:MULTISPECIES: ABC transporter substrate-binding protein [unclassified Afipia]|uniref:ABC transporter substrate-binding protein n=1 Tax=unclassified Afipia TaxID=2642050 RepID=UPI0004053F2F|nr:MULTISPECIES: ABC transporter substrate-binding protein [unclassified Afipia]
MKKTMKSFAAGAAFSAAVLMVASAAQAQKKYDPGASDTEIKLGQTVPHSGPGSLYGVIGRTQAAYFQMLNEKGGINGRKVTFLTLDDSYSAPKTVEATRRLVEQEEVLALFGSLGTGPQTAVQKYLNGKNIPQLLLNTGAGRWNDPKNFKWTTPGLPLYPTEGRILARYLLQKKPDAKVAILYQNDEFGRDYMNSFKEILTEAGGKVKVVAEASYDLTDPTIDSQMINLSKSGADVFYNISTGKATSQSIRKVAELNWKPLHLLVSTSSGRSILNAAGADNAIGIVAASYTKEVGSPKWADDPDVKGFQELRTKYLPNVDQDNTIAFQGYSQAVTMARILEKCGDELTHANVLKHATSLAGYKAPIFLPGITYSTSPDDYSPIKTLFIGTFNGKDWDLDAKPVSQ